MNNKLLTVNNKMCQTGSRKIAADGIDTDQYITSTLNVISGF